MFIENFENGKRVAKSFKIHGDLSKFLEFEVFNYRTNNENITRKTQVSLKRFIQKEKETIRTKF